MKSITIKAIFFDLDGTLLNLSDDQFEKVYAPEAYKHFSDLFTFPDFMKNLFYSTEKMLKHDDLSNPVSDTFFKYFAPAAGLSQDAAMARFLAFYESNFDVLQTVSLPFPHGPQLINNIKALHIPMIIATQPVFYSLATEKRIRWAGLNPNDFLFVTHGTNSYSCKPSLSYFQNLLKISGVQPHEALMVGNDYLFDMAAGQLGIHTWLTDTHRNHSEYKDRFVPEFQGSLLELQSFLNQITH